MKRALAKMILFLLCAACALSAVPIGLAEPAVPYVMQAVYDYALVSGSANVNVRSGPGTEYGVIAAVPEGTWVGVREEQGSWYAVYLPETGYTGYMSKNFLKRAETVSNTGVVKNPNPTQFLNLRAYPGYDAPVLGIYYNGAAFTLLSSGNDGWYQVQIDGKIGYFRREFVVMNGTGGSGQPYVIRSANGGKVNLRSAPTYSGSGILGQFAPGTQATVLLASPQANTFWKVSVNGVTGYMDARFLAASSQPVPVIPVIPVTPGNPPAAQGKAVVSNPKSSQKLNLRAAPNTSSRVIAQYGNGTRFDVLQAGEAWTKVRGSATGNVGYFMTKFLKLTGASCTKTVRNGSSYVNLRSTPSKTAGKVLARVPSGTSVTVLIPGDEWTQVRCSGTVGYMMTQFLK